VFDVLSGGTPKTNIPDYWDGDIPFFTPKDAKDDFYVLNTEKSITANGLRKCNSRLYRKNTIFITARGTVGKLVLTHTQGAGKSFSMIFYVRKIFRKLTGNFTFVVITDRVDLGAYTLSATVNSRLGQKSGYVRQAGFDPIQQEQMVIQFVRMHGRITRKDVVELCRVGPFQATRLLDKLVKRDELTRKGQKRGTYYVLAKEKI